MRFLSSLILLAVVAVPAVAQPPWYARGEFNGWGTGSVQDPATPFPMVVDPGNPIHYTQTITGLFDNVAYPYKIAGGGGDNWATSMPTTDGRVTTNAAGEIKFQLWDQTTWNDGWFPNNTRRVGYDDHQQFDWEVIGSLNNWRGSATDVPIYMTELGNGLHQAKVALNAGNYEFKFRSKDSWDTSIGNNFGNGAGNNSFNVVSSGDEWTFELDLPNGRWRAFTDAVAPIQVGDYNDNGIVDAADYTRWRNAVGTNTVLPNDPVGGTIGNQQYANWKTNFGEGVEDHWIVRSVTLGDKIPVAVGGGKYQLNIPGLTPGADHEFKVVRNDLSVSVPGSAMKVRANVDGEIDLNFYELPAGGFTDGWSPSNSPRVGYQDSEQFDWQLMGSYNGWTGDSAFNLTDQGNGLHTGSFTFPVGTHQFKFRQVDDWNTSVGNDFGNSADNNSITVTNASELWNFELDLPNGRWRAYVGSGAGSVSAVPEPSAVVMALAGLMLSLAAAPRRR